MRTYSNFASIIRAIRAKGEELDALIVQGISFIARPIVVDSNHGAGNQWTVLREAVPVYARPIVDAARKACNAMTKAKGGDPEDRLELVLLNARESLRTRRLKISNAQSANRAQMKAEAEQAEDEARAERVAKYQRAIGKKPGHPRAEASAKASNKANAIAQPYVLKGMDQEPLELTPEEYSAALKAVMEYRKAQEQLKQAA